MAFGKIISGSAREIWSDTDGQPGGGSVTVVTGIRMSPPHLSRIRGQLIITEIVGAPIPVAQVQLTPTGFLQVFIGNAVGGSSIKWVLDVERTESQQQRIDPASPNGVITVVNGTMNAVGGAQTLAQTYAFGSDPAHQRMILLDADGGGITIDGTDAGMTVNGVSLEIRQSTICSTPTVIGRRGDDALAGLLQFDKTRGTALAPANLHDNDLLGSIEFYGRVGGAPVRGARVVGIATGTAVGTTLTAGIDVYGAAASAPSQIVRLDVSGPGGTPELILYGNGYIVPSNNNQGHIGISGNIWQDLAVYTANVYANISMGGAAVGGGANLTIMLTNTAMMPGSQANQVYLGSLDFWAAANAALAVSAEALAVDIGAATADHLIPIVYNGTPYYLHASEYAPG
jgi:hypothetical protein